MSVTFLTAVVRELTKEGGVYLGSEVERAVHCDRGSMRRVVT